MDRSVRWSVDPVRLTGPRTGGQCFRVTHVIECIKTLFERRFLSFTPYLGQVFKDFAPVITRYLKMAYRMSGKDVTARIWDESDEELVSFVDSE